MIKTYHSSLKIEALFPSYSYSSLSSISLLPTKRKKNRDTKVVPFHTCFNSKSSLQSSLTEHGEKAASPTVNPLL